MTARPRWPGDERRHPSLSSPDFLHLFELAKVLRSVIPRQLSSDRQTRVLDVACARKPYLPFFAHLRPLYVGVDLSAKPAGPDCLGHSQRLPFRDDSFDVAICTQAIAYFDDPAEATAEMRRVLRPGGLLVLSSHGVYPYALDRWRYTHDGMRSLVESAGLHEVRVYPNGGAAMCLAQLLTLNLRSLVEDRHGSLDRAASNLAYCALNAAGLALDRMAGGRGATYCCMNYVVTGMKPETSGLTGEPPRR